MAPFYTFKKIGVMLSFFISPCFCLFAQDSLTLKKLNQIIDSLGKKDARQSIGNLKLNTNFVGHYFSVSSDSGKIFYLKGANKIKIDSAKLLIKDGYIIDINIFSGDKHFTNLSAPISLTGRRFQKDLDRLYNLRNSNESVIFQEIILPDSLNSYDPDDGFFVLTPQNSAITLYKNVSVNDIIDLRIYTDALGLFGSQANGIILTDARVKYFIHHRNLANHGSTFFQYVKILFNAGKFTDKNSFADSSSFSRTDLLQKSFLNAELAINFVNGWVNFKSLSNWYFDFGFGINDGKLATAKDTFNILSNFWFLEGGLNLKTSDNAGLNLSFRIMDQFTPQINWGDNGGARVFFRPAAEIYWNPFNDKANRIFARLNYTFPGLQSDKKNSFFQVQFGYSVLLSSLVKNNSKKN